MAKKDNSRFQRGSGVYVCRICSKRTRETGEGESSVELCFACYERAGWENTHSDEDHSAEEPGDGCPICAEEFGGVPLNNTVLTRTGIQKAVHEVLAEVPHTGMTTGSIRAQVRELLGDWPEKREVSYAIQVLKRKGIVRAVGPMGGRRQHYALRIVVEAHLAEREREKRGLAREIADTVLVAADRGESTEDAVLELLRKQGLVG